MKLIPCKICHTVVERAINRAAICQPCRRERDAQAHRQRYHGLNETLELYGIAPHSDRARLREIEAEKACEAMEVSACETAYARRMRARVF